jgi:spermidine synthase
VNCSVFTLGLARRVRVFRLRCGMWGRKTCGPKQVNVGALPDSLMSAESAPPAAPHPEIHTEGRRVSLRFNMDSIQSTMHLDDPTRLELEYTRTMMLFLLFNAVPRAILMIGLGGGSLPKFCHHHLPDADITVVEINPAVIALRELFQVPPDSARFRVLEDDGARHVRATGVRYDVILVDGFHAEGQPEALGTQDFYDACRAILQPEGVLVVNLDSDPAVSEPLIARLEHAFDGGVQSMLTDGGTNRIALATAAPGRLREARCHARRRLQALSPALRATLNQRAGASGGWPVLG